MITYQDKNHSLYEGLPFMEIRGNRIPFPCFAEVKLDGEFQYVIKNKGKVFLLNKREHGRIREGMPITKLDIPDNTILLGELVWGAGKFFYDFAKHKLSPDNNLGIFGCLRWDGEDIWKTKNYLDVRKFLESQKFYNSKVALTPKAICRNQQELDGFFNKVVTAGYEGIVIIDPYSKFVNGVTVRRAKKKFVADNDFVIIGFQNETKRAKTLSVLVGHRVNGKVKRLCYVGGGFTLEQKNTLLRVLKDMIIAKNGEEYLVDPKIIITVKHYGIIRNDKGEVHSLRHPQFKCFRLDKAVNQIDTIR